MTFKIKNLAIIILLVACLAGCGNVSQQNDYEKALLGKWAYAHDLDTVVANFKDSGSAKFENNTYKYTSDGEFIKLTSMSDKDINLRYVQKDDQMYVYVQSVYTCQNPENQDGVVGVWLCEDKQWTYEFTSKGTFMEDGALTGYYEVNEEAGTIKLMYGEALEDTVFYYQLTDEGLFIEYPWLMKRISK